MRKISLLLIVLFTGSTYSQNYTSKEINVYAQLHHRVINDNYKKTESIIGSPYLTDKFLNGKIYLNDSLLGNKVALRYNIFDDQIEIKDPSVNKEGTYGSLLKTLNIKVEILIDKYKYFKSFKNPSDGSLGSYLQILQEGKNYKLLKKYEVTFQPKEEYKSPYNHGKKAEFVRKTYYYVLNIQGEFIEFPDRKSKLARNFKNKGKKLKSFISKNNIDLKEENGLIQVFKYLDKLPN